MTGACLESPVPAAGRMQLRVLAALLGGPEIVVGIKPDLDALRLAIEARVVELREALRGALAAGRRAFGALLGDRRRLAQAGPEKGFRVEELFRLALWNAKTPAIQADGRLVKVVAGARNVPVGARAIPETWHRLAA